MAVILYVGRCHSKTKTNDDLPSCDTATECMMLCEKSFRPFSKRSERMSRFTDTLAYTRSFCEFVGVWTVNILSSVNHVLANLIQLQLQSSATVSCRDRRLQDGAPAHRSRKTVAFFTAHVPDFDEPENWPPNSPDLNPVDYLI